MKNKIVLLVGMLVSLTASAQKECGTKAPPPAKYAQLQADASTARQGRLMATTKYVRVFITDFLSADGTDSSWSRQEINDEFQQAKNLMQPYNICLVLMGVDYIRNTDLQDVAVSDESATIGASYHNDCLNMYLHKTLLFGTIGLNGVAYYLGGNTMSLSRGAITQRSMAHEVGHCFGLLHTFETAYGLECPDGSNASGSGDKITDTRATPDDDAYIATNTNMACAFTGNRTLYCNGATRTYNPEITNLMSYGQRTCRQFFSPLQNDFMHGVLLTSYWLIRQAPMPATNTIANQSVSYDALYISTGLTQIGNHAATINTTLGFTGRQRYLSEGQVKITPGSRIMPSSERCKVVIKATPVCNETINYSF